MSDYKDAMRGILVQPDPAQTAKPEPVKSRQQAESTLEFARSHYLTAYAHLTAEELRHVYAATQSAENRLAGKVHYGVKMFAIGKRAAIEQLILSKKE